MMKIMNLIAMLMGIWTVHGYRGATTMPVRQRPAEVELEPEPAFPMVLPRSGRARATGTRYDMGDDLLGLGGGSEDPRGLSVVERNVGYDIGCGCGRSTQRLAEEYPWVTWVGIDKLRYPVRATRQPIEEFDFLDDTRFRVFFLPECSGKHVHLGCWDSLQELWRFQEDRAQFLHQLHALIGTAPSVTLVIQDRYPDIPGDQIRFLLEGYFEPYGVRVLEKVVSAIRIGKHRRIQHQKIEYRFVSDYI